MKKYVFKDMLLKPFILSCAIIASAISCGGDVFETILERDTMKQPLIDHSIYVSPAGNDDAGQGSRRNPFATIQKGIAAADERCLSAVRVAAGIYEVIDDNGIEMVEGISLFGGYNSTDWSRNPVVTKADREEKQTLIVYTGSQPGAGLNPSRAIFASGSEITPGTLIEGFTIRGKDGGDRVSAVFCTEGASPTFRYNTIEGGQAGANQRTHGVYNYDSASPVIENNYIHGGLTSGTGSQAYGIFNYNSSTTIIKENEIYGGQGAATYGVFNYGSSPEITSNTIYGGEASSSSAFAVYNTTVSSPQIANNDIDGGKGRWAYGIGNFSNSNADIYANIIYGGKANDQHSYGIHNNASAPTIRGNTIDAGEGTLTYGINNIMASSPLVYNNTVYGGKSNTTRAFGIFVVNTGTNPHVYNNTIHTGEISDSSLVQSGAFGIFINDNVAKPVIINNIIFSGNEAKTYGIYNSNSTASPAQFDNNDIDDCETLYAIQQTLPTITKYTSIDDVNALPFAEDNVSINPEFVDRLGGNWRLTADTAAAVKSGNKDLSSYFTTDIEGAPRSNWSMGAYEWTGLP